MQLYVKSSSYDALYILGRLLDGDQAKAVAEAQTIFAREH